MTAVQAASSVVPVGGAKARQHSRSQPRKRTTLGSAKLSGGGDQKPGMALLDAGQHRPHQATRCEIGRDERPAREREAVSLLGGSDRGGGVVRLERGAPRVVSPPTLRSQSVHGSLGLWSSV